MIGWMTGEGKSREDGATVAEEEEKKVTERRGKMKGRD